MAGVIVRADESIDKALRRFKKVCKKAGIQSDEKKNRYFEKPSDKKRRKQAQAAQVRRQEEEKRKKFQKKQEKYYNDLVLDIEKESVRDYSEKGYKNVVLGHTHLPKLVNDYYNIIYMNSGDWTHNKTYAKYITDDKRFVVYNVGGEMINYAKEH